MRRNLELIRDVMLYLEAKDGNKPCWGDELPLPKYSSLELAYHANLMAQAKLIDYEPALTENGRIIKCLVFSLSWSGHEYLDDIRDPEVWAKTKEGAQRVGGFGLEMVAAFARALVRQKVKDLTGFEI